MDDRLGKQIVFLKDIGRLVTIQRRTLICDGSRRENDAEHSWHMAMAALLLREYAAWPQVDVSRAVEMSLVHDLVEIYAGDTYAYDPAANIGREEREQKAATQVFGQLPFDQAVHFRGLWEEFEARETPEAKYAAALDRVQSVILNHSTEGKSWRDHGVSADQVRERIEPVRDGSPKLWEYLMSLVEDAHARGWLK